MSRSKAALSSSLFEVLIEWFCRISGLARMS